MNNDSHAGPLVYHKSWRDSEQPVRLDLLAIKIWLHLYVDKAAHDWDACTRTLWVDASTSRRDAETAFATRMPSSIVFYASSNHLNTT